MVTEPDTAGAESGSSHSPLFEQATDAIAQVELDDDRSILDVNPQFESVFGCDRGSVDGESLCDTVVPEGATDQRVEALPPTADAGAERVEVRRRTADGVGVFLYRFVPCFEPDDQSDSKSGYAMYTDITERASDDARHQDGEQYRRELYTITSDTDLSDEEKIDKPANDVFSALTGISDFTIC